MRAWRAGGSMALAVTVALFAVGAAFGWPGRPHGAAPTLDQPGPPPAWVETATTSRWLAFSSYCWNTTCVDMLPPTTRPDLPQITVHRRQLVRFHLGFTPQQATATVLSGSSSSRFSLPRARTMSSRASKSGILTLELHAAAGSASYTIRVKFS